MRKLPAFVVLFCFTTCFVSFGQVESFPMGFLFQQQAQRGVLLSDSICFLSSYPLIKEKLPLTMMEGQKPDSVKVYHDLAPFFLRNDMIDFSLNDVRVRLNLIYDFSAGRDFIDTIGYARGEKLYTNRRGAWLQVNFKDRAYVESGFYETQAFLPKYLQGLAQVDSLNIFPGFGRVKPYRTEGVDYNMAFSVFRVKVKPDFTVALGYGKHKIGNGYRSLLWSDGMFCYPYLEYALQKKNFRVMHVWSVMQNMRRLPLGDTPESLFERKGGSFSVVSYMPKPWVEFSVFESTIWNRYRNNEINSPDWLYYSPIPLTGLTQFVSSRNKSTLGMDFNLRFKKKMLLYGQSSFVISDVNRIAWNRQIGIQIFQFLVPNLDVNIELNEIAPHAYSQAYQVANGVHMNQNIGHPLENCNEKLLRVSYRYARWMINAKLNLINQEVERPIIDGFETGDRSLSQWEIQASYWFNPKTNSQIFIQYADRIDTYTFMNQDFGYHSAWLSLGLRSNLHAIYQDF
jgi:hypothetical protein